jgi:hypothetical protein
MSEQVISQRLLDEGLLPRLMQLLSSDDLSMRVSVLWAIRNTLRTSVQESRETVMNNLGWPQLVASVSIPVPAD